MAYVPSVDLVPGVLAGEVRSIARLLTRAESGVEEARVALDAIFGHAGRAHIVGITGVPGSGKSTLVAKLAAAIRRSGRKVAIVAIDPSSPFTGGSILGDRIRMGDLAGDAGVYVRSMATRGSLGGLARGTLEAVDVLDAAGYDLVIIETVGVGQDEVEVARAAHTTVVVSAPGLGDDIQAIKAGILEIADVFVVNKSDREGADRTAAELSMMLDLTPGRPWRPPIVRTVAPRGEGVAEVVEAMESHGRWLSTSSEAGLRAARRAKARLLALLEEKFRRTIESCTPDSDGFDEAIRRIRERREDPYSAAARLFDRLTREPAAERA